MALLGGVKVLGFSAVRGEGRGLGLIGGFKVLAVMSADIAAAYEDDMVNWSLVSWSTAAEKAQMKAALGGNASGKNTCALKIE